MDIQPTVTPSDEPPADTLAATSPPVLNDVTPPEQTPVVTPEISVVPLNIPSSDLPAATETPSAPPVSTDSSAASPLTSMSDPEPAPVEPLSVSTSPMTSEPTPSPSMPSESEPFSNPEPASVFGPQPSPGPTDMSMPTNAPVNPPAPVHTEHKHSNKLIVIVAVLVGLILAAAALFIYLKSGDSAKPVVNTVTGTTVEETGPLTSDNVDTASQNITNSIGSLDDSQDFSETDLSDATLGL